MTKPELGTKRLCAHCGAKFYDLHHSPITCPKCSTVFEIAPVVSSFGFKAARAPVRETKLGTPETNAVQFASAEDAEAETPSNKPAAADFEGDDEKVGLDDASLNSASLTEEIEDGEADVTDNIGDDGAADDET
jgi:uncharacterized protein (TIGR02300 family)